MNRMTPGELWWDLRKGTTQLYVEWGAAQYGTVFATQVRMQKGPPVTIALSLEVSLHQRSKSSTPYLEAKDLADGGLRTLRLVQISDEYAISGLTYHLGHTDDITPPWRLVIELRGQHEFQVDPEFRPLGSHQELLLRVVGGRDAADQGMES